jgi:predicted site-specific integrase-resolvase
VTADTAAPGPLLLKPRDAARALAVSERTLWGLVKSGEIPCLRIPGRGKARAIRYDVRDLLGWIERVKAAAHGQP